ncbi:MULTISPECIES: DUF4157 domain-containing protein [unclassified Streptomyces]|uniref:eCIS core domain-containing protein n=1 Tax=unclassified Streptomyces TaxID=2593676 RepID=UPI002252D02D|nr:MULTISPECIES: DUF4157 domain-containing protein [unclassified Streptomyces]MCX5055565.1 DUF4157 domain-containing protein [Streptomyces sp. NBC_00452]MCX5286630.1 DUF4157 domain-containing protein [Streptomyces sp. NBC_00183]
MQTSRTTHTEQSGSGQPVRRPAPARRESSAGGAAVPPPLSAEMLRAVQRAAGNAAVTGMIARRARTAPAAEQAVDTGVEAVLDTNGKPLAEPVRREMESRFDTDFSDVRLHTGAAAARSARAIGARAYTSGSHVVLGTGGGDKHTLAHELRHVEQQRSGPVSGTDTGHGFAMSHPRDDFEQDAEATARKVMSGPAPVQRRPQAGQDGAAPTAGGDTDTVQRASATTLEDAVVSHYVPTRENAQPAYGLTIKRPREVKGSIKPTGTKGRAAAPNPIAVKSLHEVYKGNKAKGTAAPTEAMVWKDLFGGAGFDRGHVMGLEVGGSDVAQNIVPQWSLNQGTGMWRRIEHALVGVSKGDVRFEVHYATRNGNHHGVMIPTHIDIYLNNAHYDAWENEPDANDLIRSGRDPNDLAAFYTRAKDALGGLTQLTEDQMQHFAFAAMSRDRADYLALQDFERERAAGRDPGPGDSTADTHRQTMKLGDFPKDRRDKLIEAYVDGGWVTKSGTGDNATYTLGDPPAPALDSDTESSSQSSDSDVDMSDGSQPTSPGQPFATIQFGSQGSSSDGDWEDRMDTD